MEMKTGGRGKHLAKDDKRVAVAVKDAGNQEPIEGVAFAR
jgi:hypothetical protein